MNKKLLIKIFNKKNKEFVSCDFLVYLRLTLKISVAL